MDLKCVKRDTVFASKKDEVIWYFWQEAMKQKETWKPYLYPKNTDPVYCFECTDLFTELRWTNPASYEIILDNVVQNIYCNVCYNKWTKPELNETPSN